MTYEPHPAADHFPLLQANEYEGLKANIAEHGLMLPIWLCEGRILDGRNRYRACIELGIEPTVKQYEGSSPLAGAWSLNGQRRHLTPSQRAAIAVGMLGPLKEEAKKRQEATHAKPGQRADQRPNEFGGTLNGDAGEAVGQAAKIVGVGKTLVQEAKLVHDNDPELFKQIRAGTLPTHRARKALGARKAPGALKEKAPRHQPLDQRAAELSKLVAKGYLAGQIAAELGIGERRVRYIAKAKSITLPDAAIGRPRRPNSKRILTETINGVDAYVSGLSMLDDLEFPELSSQERTDLLQALSRSINGLKKLRTKFVEKEYAGSNSTAA